MGYVKRRVGALVSRGELREDAIILSLYGYQGGSICTTELTIAQAKALRDNLDEALALMLARPVQ